MSSNGFQVSLYSKMSAVMKYYDVNFSFKRVGALYDLASKIASTQWPGFDLINLSGVLYHVFSPFHVLAGLRPLLKKNGLIIVSTNVVIAKVLLWSSTTAEGFSRN